MQDAVELYPTFGWPRNKIEFILAGGIKSLQRSIENAEDDVLEARKNFIEKKKMMLLFVLLLVVIQNLQMKF